MNFYKIYQNKKVLVTGATGFKGAWLCLWLHILGAKVYAVGYSPNKNKNLFYSLNLHKKIKINILDIRDKKKLSTYIMKNKPQFIFHLAAQSIVSLSYTKPLETFGTNVIGSANILESSRLNKVPNLVYITSDKCYLNLDKASSYKETDILGGLDNYSSSKASAEIIFNSFFKSYYKKNFLSAASARAGNVIGGGDFKKDRVVPDVIKSLKNGKKIILRNPNATRPWQHVLEPLSGYLILGNKLMNKDLKSNLIPSWNFGPYKKNCKKVRYIVQLLIKEWGDKKQKILITKNKNFHESQLLSLNIEKAYKELSWKPRLTLKETINFTVDWYKYYFLDKKVEKVTNYQLDYYTDK